MRLAVEELEVRFVPSITASGTSLSPIEGQAFHGAVATFTDTDMNATVQSFTATIVWGDGTTTSGTVQATSAGFQVIGDHTYADEGAYGVGVTINDIDGSSAMAASTAQVADNDALSATGYNLVGTEGQEINGIVATFTDATYPMNSPDDFTANIRWGDGSNSAGIISTQGNLFLVRGSHTYAEESNYYIQVTIDDDGGASATAIASSYANIADAPLSATGTPVTATEGQNFSGQVATFTDANPNAGLDDFTQTYYGYPPIFYPIVTPLMPIGQNAPISKVTIDWGDGTTPSLGNGQITQPGGVGTPFEVSGNHTYAEEGSYTIKVTITDNGGSKATVTTTATVADAPLTATGTPVHAVEGVAFTGQVATFADANPNAPLNDFVRLPVPCPVCPSCSCIPTLGSAVTIDWGDGTTTFEGNGSITQPGGVGTPFVVSGSHTYVKAGSYTISLSIFDEGGSTPTTTTTATVTDPTDILGRVNETGQIWTGVSTGSSFSSSMWAALDPTVTWVDPVVGDFNGDGLTDIAARDANTGKWWVGLSNGSGFTMSVWTTWSTFATWVDVQVGDFNGDGKADIVGRYAQGGEWWVALSNGSSFTNSRWDTWSTFATWVDVKVGDFNGDGKADITGRYLQGGTWWTGISTGSSFTTTKWATWSTFVKWVDVQVGDFDGDGKADITGRALETGDWWTALSSGASFVTSPAPWATWSTSVTWVDVHVDDFNGDGASDIVGRALETGDWWVGLSRDHVVPLTAPSNSVLDVRDFVPIPLPMFSTTQWSTWSTGVTWGDVQVGDFNGDGKSDITGRALQTGDWWTGMSNGSGFDTSKWATWSTSVNWAGVRTGDFA